MTDGAVGNIIEASLEQSVILEPQKNFPLHGALAVNREDDVHIRLVSAQPNITQAAAPTQVASAGIEKSPISFMDAAIQERRSSMREMKGGEQGNKLVSGSSSPAYSDHNMKGKRAVAGRSN